MNKILVIDDDAPVRLMVRKSLEQYGYEVIEANDGQLGLEMAREHNPDTILLDIMLPRTSGIDIFHSLKESLKKTPVIFITSGTDSATAIETMRMGGYDYVTKPLNLPALAKVVASAVESRRLMNTPVAIYAENPKDHPADLFVGSSSQMVEVFKTIGRIATQNVTALIRGESGTGKELVARAIYQYSSRSNEPFIAVNCAAIPDQLLESELFGHEKGAFTGADRRRIGKFEQCDGGTIFLDEVGDMSPLVQGKVLRLLQEQRFERVGGNETIQTNVRIIAATNCQLEKMVEEGEYRADLFYRLNQVSVLLPPLRDRGGDVEALLKFFLSRQRIELGKHEVEGISLDALNILKSYPWPGNIRELQSVLRHALLNTTGTVIVPTALPKEILSSTTLSPSSDFQSSKPNIQTSSTLSSFSTEESSQFSLASSTSYPEHSLDTTHVDQNRLGYSNEPVESIVDFVNDKLQSGSTNLYAESVELLERFLIPYVLQYTDGNQSKAAEILGITRGKVRDRIVTFGIRLDKNVSIASE